MYIALEGIDTAGKSTQIARLKEHFKDALFTKEPGGSSIGLEIRKMLLNSKVNSPKAEFLLFLADRAEHIQSVIKPNLDRLIISDRSVVSGVAYALANQTLQEGDVLYLNRFATDNILPKKIFLLYLSKDELEFRLSQKEQDGIELRGIKYLLDIQELLIKATKLLGIELILIDAKSSLEDITTTIIKHIN